MLFTRQCLATPANRNGCYVQTFRKSHRTSRKGTVDRTESARRPPLVLGHVHCWLARLTMQNLASLNRLGLLLAAAVLLACNPPSSNAEGARRADASEVLEGRPDPLPSWNEGSAKKAIRDFVGRVYQRRRPGIRAHCQQDRSFRQRRHALVRRNPSPSSSPSPSTA